MERAFADSDASFNGLFVTAVKTTGIFCRPVCPARKARPENLEFFATNAEALAAGYRPCRRCDPLTANGETPGWLKPLFTRLDHEPQSRLSGKFLTGLGLEPARVRRWFRQHLGMSFADFDRRRRLGQAAQSLAGGTSLDDAALDHGYESLSGFRDAFARHFGSPPGAAGPGQALTAAVFPSPLGPLLCATTGDAICLLEFSDPARLALTLRRLEQRFARPLVPGNHPLLERLRDELEQYFQGRRDAFSLPLTAPGTAFQERVWTELQRILPGTTISYAELADRIGQPRARRAVGLANGANRIAILIPCHRVVNAGGRLGGYGGGLWRKRLLLELERTRKPLPGQPETTQAIASGKSVKSL